MLQKYRKWVKAVVSAGAEVGVWKQMRRSCSLSPAFMFMVRGAAAVAQSATGNAPIAPPHTQVQTEPLDTVCPSYDARKIVVCGQRRQFYRPDPSIMEAGREAESNSRSATSATPAAQAVCSSAPLGCTKDFSNLDLANVAVVVGTAAVKAAKGDDWTKVLRPGGPNEYQLYRQGMRRREAEADERAAAEEKRKAKAQEREEAARRATSNPSLNDH